MDGLKIAAIGGGTGLSTMLKGLKLYTQNISAIVTVADDGGSSGVLRADYGMLPPGDVRNCVSALANVDPITSQMLNYRFTEGVFEGHSLGNIILAALNEMSGSFEEAVEKLNHIMGVVGTVYPVTNEKIMLGAVLENGEVIEGESKIGTHRNGKGKGIDRVYLTPKSPKAVEQAIEAIENADVVVLGPGSLYTSIIPNLLVDGITAAIKRTKAIKIYVCNLMQQQGETENYTASDHLEALEKHSYKGIADVIIVNDARIPEELKIRYEQEYAHEILSDTEKVADRTAVVKGNFMLIKDGKIRHNFSRLARAIITIGKTSFNGE